MAKFGPRDLANLRELGATIWGAIWRYGAIQIQIHSPPPRPGPGLRWEPESKKGPGMPLVGPLTLPPDTDDNVARRIVRIWINGKPNPAKVFDNFPPINPDNNLPDPNLAFNEGAQVKITCAFVDTDDLESEECDPLEFTAVDRLRPGKPGALQWQGVVDDPAAVAIDNPPDGETGETGEEEEGEDMGEEDGGGV